MVTLFTYLCWVFLGIILRQSKGISTADATRFASEILKLASRARHVIRDLDPKVCFDFLDVRDNCHQHFPHKLWNLILQNDLEIFRLRSKDREILAAPGNEFLVIIIQKWQAAPAS